MSAAHPDPTGLREPAESAPSERRAAWLVEMLALAPGHHVLDLGCGTGELLLRLVEAHPAATGTGVDRDRLALDRGRRAAAQRGLQERVELVEGDPASIRARGHLVLCVGAVDPWGGAEPALRALPGHLEPGGWALLAARVSSHSGGGNDAASPPSVASLLEAAAEAGLDVERLLPAAGVPASPGHPDVAWLLLRPRRAP